MRELPIPAIDDDSAILRIEACGICGSDVEQYTGTIPVPLPVIPGHEPLGMHRRDRRPRRQALEGRRRRPGRRRGADPVRPLPRLPRAAATRCAAAAAAMFAHGYVPLSHAPGLWGGYADYMYLDPCSIVHKVRADIPASLAVMFNPLGAGFRWAVEIPSTGPGDTVLDPRARPARARVGDRRSAPPARTRSS